MLYKPSYCCNCGEKIERVDWAFTNSRRFCDVCQTDHLIEDWLPLIFAAAMAAIGLVGIGSYLKAAEPPPAFTKPAAPRPQSSVRPAANASATNSATPRSANSNGQDRLTNVRPADAEDASEICGAITKKGTPCTRRVKGGGRCWQHREQAPDKPRPRP